MTDKRFTPDMISDAQDVQVTTGVPAAVTLVQYLKESGCGQHEPPGSNNGFGIKARPGEPYVTASTLEYDTETKRYIRINARFRAYPNRKVAFAAHAAVFAHPIYAEGMRLWLAGDLNGGMSSVAKHYATDPDYGRSCINLIAVNGLAQYDVVRPKSLLGTSSPATDAAPARETATGVKGKPMLKLSVIQSMLAAVTTYGPAVGTAMFHAAENRDDIVKNAKDMVKRFEAFDLETAEADAKRIFDDIGVSQNTIAGIIAHAVSNPPPK